MKKIALGFLLVAAVGGVARGQQSTSEGFACTAPPVSHWSVGLKTGPAYASGFDATAGASLEYSINPFVGFGLEGNYFMKSNGLQGLGYGSLNLSNLLATYRSGFWKKTNIFMVAGAGARFVTTGSGVFALAGWNMEYNLSKAFALELGAEGFVGGGNAVLASFGLRYKFCSSRRQHARNADMCDFIPKPAPIVITENKGQDNFDQLNARLKAAEQQQSTLQQKAQNLTDELNSLQNRK